MKNFTCFLVFASLFISLTQAQIETPWLENANNPIFGQGKGGPKAYYPTVLYDEAEFSGHGVAARYKMWYGADNSRVGIAYSQDGVVWQDGGLVTGNVFYHCKVLYDATGFGNGTYFYRMWYYDPSLGPYTYQAIKVAESEDGVNWVNDRPIEQDLAQPLVTSVCGWFYHTYGPAAVLYNPNGLTSFNDADPLAHPYVMYYDVSPENCMPGEIEATALAYSLDGIFWKRYSDTPVICSGADTDWDANYIYVWSVLKINDAYHLWYSGGNAASSEGIGYAYSSDGINWVKPSATPLFHISDGITWRSERCYTPSVLAIGNQLKMWFSGKDATTGAYSIGLAENNLIRTQTVAIDFLPGTCPNYLNLRQKGTFEVVIFGERDLDVKEIVASSLQFVGEKPQKVHYRDAGSAGLPGDCPISKKDGYLDLVLSFSAPTIAAHFYGIPNGTVVSLDLTGNLQNGALIQGSDIAAIVNSRRQKGAFDDHSNPLQLSVTPNPFNPVTMLSFEIREPAAVELKIYNLRGAVVTELVRDNYQPGVYSIYWDGSQLPSGIYLGVLRVGNSISVQRLMLLK